jgi:hypothetical protein
MPAVGDLMRERTLPDYLRLRVRELRELRAHAPRSTKWCVLLALLRAFVRFGVMKIHRYLAAGTEFAR